MTSEPPPVPRNILSNRWMVALLFACAAAALRFFRLDGQSLWNDEMFSMTLGAMDLGSLRESLLTQFHHPPLFFVLLHGIFSAFGSDAWWLRFLPALAGSLTVGVVFASADVLFGRGAAVAAGLLLLVSPFHLAYSQEGRPYALAALLALVGTVACIRYVRTNKWGDAWLWALSSLLLIYTHHWGFFVVFPQALLLARHALRQKTPRLPSIAFGLFVAALASPAVLFLLRQAPPAGSGGWWWSESPSLSTIWLLGEAFGGGHFRMASSTFNMGSAVSWSAALFVAGGIAAAIAGSKGTPLRQPVLGVAFVFFGTLAVPFSLAFIRPEIFLWYRYPVIAAPHAALLIGAGLSTLRYSKAAVLCSAALVVIGMAGTERYFSWSKSNARDAASYVGELASDSIHIVIRPAAIAPLINYYYKGTAVQYDEAYFNTPLGGIIDTARSFIYVSLDVPNDIRNYCDGHFIRTAERVFPGEAHMGLRVGAYVQPPEPPDTTDEARQLFLGPTSKRTVFTHVRFSRLMTSR